MERKLFEKIAEDVFSKSNEILEKELKEHDPLIITEADLLDYINRRLDIYRAHQERYTTELIWRAIHLLSIKE